MKIPNKIRIGGMELNTEFCENLNGRYAETCIGAGYIKITKSFQGLQHSESSMNNSYIHEVTHAILDTMGKTELSSDEVFVSSFAGYMTEFVYQLLDAQKE